MVSEPKKQETVQTVEKDRKQQIDALISDMDECYRGSTQGTGSWKASVMVQNLEVGRKPQIDASILKIMKANGIPGFSQYTLIFFTLTSKIKKKIFSGISDPSPILIRSCDSDLAMRKTILDLELQGTPDNKIHVSSNLSPVQEKNCEHIKDAISSHAYQVLESHAQLPPLCLVVVDRSMFQSSVK
ncbi:hypothetical protein Tco_0881070 [Tanacetum coccineum]